MSVPTHIPPGPLPTTVPTQSGSATHSAGRGRIAATLSNVVVYGLLACVFYAGHRSGWKMPALSTLMNPAPAVPDDWCQEHLVPESQCVACNPGLWARAKEFGFCRQHGVAECVIDHPELAQVKGTPHLPKFDTVEALAIRDRQENNSRNLLHKSVIQVVSAESAVKAGIDIDVAFERSMTEAITANGELRFDPTCVAHLSSRVNGTVAVAFKKQGDEVRAGEALALVDGAQVGQAKSQLLHSVVQLQLRRANVKRLSDASNAVAGKILLDAEAALKEAEIGYISARQSLVNLGFDLPDGLDHEDALTIDGDLRFLGLRPEALAALPGGTRTANLIPIRAAYDGVVVGCDVVAGEVVNTTNILFTIADPRRLWLTLSVRPEDARYTKVGLPVTFQTDASPEEVTGSISWISPTIDERSRTLQVRVQVENRDGRLRDQMFGTGRIVLRSEPHAIVVPRESLQSTTDAQFVFVRDRDYLKEGSFKLFHVRQVRTGAHDDQYVELLAGVLPGEVVATSGSAVLMGQLLRSNLGAGCGCHEK